MEDCIFCKIVTKDILASLVYEDDHLIAFPDINPQAPTHILIIPKKHISTLNELSVDNHQIVGTMIYRATEIARELGHTESGYRTVFNCNKDAGQTVFHIHLHLLGGRSLKWPPG